MEFDPPRSPYADEGQAVLEEIERRRREMAEQQKKAQQEAQIQGAVGAYAGKKALEEVIGVGGSGVAEAATESAASLPWMSQADNVIAGAPANSVSSMAMADGSAGIGMAQEGGGVLGAGEPVAGMTEPGSLSGFGTVSGGPIGQVMAGNYTVGSVLGTAGGIYGAYDMISNFGDMSTQQGAMDGAAIGTAILPGVGTIIGAVAGGLLGHFDKALTGDKDMWKTEGDRWDELGEKGVTGPDRNPIYQDQHGNVVGVHPQDLTGGRSTEDRMRQGYAEDFQGFDEFGTWINNKFLNDFSALRPQDIKEFAGFYETVSGYGEMNDYQKYAVAKYALENGLVDWHHGTVDFKDPGKVAEFAEGIKSDQALSELSAQEAQDRWVTEEGYDPRQVAEGQMNFIKAQQAAQGAGEPDGSSLDSILASISARSAAASAAARAAQEKSARREKALTAFNMMQDNVNRVEAQVRGSPISVATGKQDLDNLINGILA